jgi:anti-sigma regulatory factor (Ser/Thr protein kinase)
MPPRSERAEYVRLSLPAEPRHLCRLRHTMNEYLSALPLTTARRDEIVLAVGEAAANAVEHAYCHQPEPGVVDVTFWTESDAIWVEIRDFGRWREPPPGPRPPGQGLGIVLMRRLIDCVLIHHDHRGTNVLLRHPVNGPAPYRSPALSPGLAGRATGAHQR